MTGFVRISFSGENFYGTQKLPQKRTIQGVFEGLLSSLYQTEVKVTICSRLDRGVNAWDYVLSFPMIDARVDEKHLFYYLERSTKEDISILDVRFLNDEMGFSARYSCDYKRYLYLIENKKERTVFYQHFVYHPEMLLDEDKVKEILPLFEGKHDFRFFSSPEGEENTILTIDKTSLEKKGSILFLRFQGKSFLRYQIRFLVGEIIRYATNKSTLERTKKLLEGKEEAGLKYKARPEGLMLECIHYPDLDKEDRRFRFPCDSQISK